MNERQQEELSLLQAAYPELEFREEGLWCRIPSYAVPEEVWGRAAVEVCFQIPEGVPGQNPYGFYTFPQLIEPADVQGTDNYKADQSTPFGGERGLFSWSPVSWQAKESAAAGDNMLTFVRSFAERLAQR